MCLFIDFVPQMLITFADLKFICKTEDHVLRPLSLVTISLLPLSLLPGFPLDFLLISTLSSSLFIEVKNLLFCYSEMSSMP